MSEGSGAAWSTAETAALAKAAFGQGNRMRQDRAGRLIQRDGAEAHQRRRAAVIWAMMLTAISAGVRAPMSNPTGA